MAEQSSHEMTAHFIGSTASNQRSASVKESYETFFRCWIPRTWRPKLCFRADIRIYALTVSILKSFLIPINVRTNPGDGTFTHKRNQLSAMITELIRDPGLNGFHRAVLGTTHAIPAISEGSTECLAVFAYSHQITGAYPHTLRLRFSLTTVAFSLINFWWHGESFLASGFVPVSRNYLFAGTGEHLYVAGLSVAPTFDKAV